jgi:hypothetical protein
MFYQIRNDPLTPSQFCRPNHAGGQGRLEKARLGISGSPKCERMSEKAFVKHEVHG